MSNPFAPPTQQASPPNWLTQQQSAPTQFPAAEQFPAAPQQPQFPSAPPAPQFPAAPQPGGLPQFPAAPQAASGADLRSPDDILSGGGKAFTFGNAQLGFKRLNVPFGGKVLEVSTSQVTHFTTKLPETWPDGRPKLQVVVKIDTTQGQYPEREDESDDGIRSLYVKGSMIAAVRKALSAAGSGVQLRPNGFLYGCHTGTAGQAYTWMFQYTPGA